MIQHPVFQEPQIASILSQEYGRFSDAEYARRRQALADVMAKHGVDHLLMCGEQRAGNGVYWLTGWPTSTEAIVLFTPGQREVLFVEWYNHVPNARNLAVASEVRWGELKGPQKAIEEIKRRGGKRVGFMGLLSWSKMRTLSAAFDLVDLNLEYPWLRMRKSDEEIDWLRIGAAFSDLGIAALMREAKPGLTERELGNLVEREYHGLGGSTLIHFIGVNDMTNPARCIPRNIIRRAGCRKGDMMFVEFSALFWDSPGQVLRTFAVGAEPTPLFRDLYATAEAAFSAITKILRAGVHAQEVVDASGLIEEAGFTTYDDIFHGFGGGYWPPVLGFEKPPLPDPVPDMQLEANMTVVVQPNVITRDERAGVQLGELVRITPTGFERLHHAPWGFLRVG